MRSTTAILVANRSRTLLRGGHAEALVGQAEGQWLEAKRQHCDLGGTAGTISLAQAVARFANAEQGGLVVVGLETKDAAGEEVIRKVTPMPHDPRIVRKYKHPRTPPLPARGRPADRGHRRQQRRPHPYRHSATTRDLKPFLVHGAVIDGKTEDAFISIVRRRGDFSIPTTAAMIHATLAAGRALLRRGELPSPPAD
jgi:hypothetical protein